MYDVHPKTVHRWAREGKIPAPVMRFTEPCWRREEIEEHIASMKRMELKELAS
jgi:predicted site-specific integrase-resolvase